MEKQELTKEEQERLLNEAAGKILARGGCIVLGGLLLVVVFLIYLLGLHCVKQTIKTFSPSKPVEEIEEPFAQQPSPIP